MGEGARDRARWWRLVVVVGAVGLWLALVILSPFGLLVLDRLDRQEWDRLSAIGQTYGAVSALLAAMALCGVAVSIVQQQRSAQVDREHVYRAVHIELSRMLLDHPDLMESYTSLLGASTPAEQRLNIYCNQQVLALQMGFEIGAVDEDYLAGSGRELFGSAAGYRWWERVRAGRRVAATTERQRRLVEVLDREWQRATPTGRRSGADDRPVPATTSGDADPAVPSRPRRTAVAVVAGAGAGAVLALSRARRRRAGRLAGAPEAG